MFRSIGKSKIALILAILFGISLFFFRGGSRYSNLLNSDNVIASVSGTPISTTKFNRTLKMNVDEFNQILNKSLSKNEIIDFQIHSLALNALINDAIFENEFDKINFSLDETVIAKKTKERIPQLYNKENKLNESYLSKFLQQQQLKIEDIVQIIDFETRNNFFDDAFFNVNYPVSFLKKIDGYENHLRKIKLLKIPIDKYNLSDESIITNDSILNFYNDNINQYMSEEKRDVEYIKIDKEKFFEKFTPSDFEISSYYEENKNLYIEKEKRSFMQFNFKSIDEAKEFKNEIINFNTYEEIANFAKNNKIKYNEFIDLSKDDLLNEISESLFNLVINEQSDIIETALAKHILILKNFTPEKQLNLNEAKDKIIQLLSTVEVNNYYDYSFKIKVN